MQAVMDIISNELKPIFKQDSLFDGWQFPAPVVETVEPQILPIPQERSQRGIENLLASMGPVSDYNTNTMGRVSYRTVDPLPRAEIVSKDARLQTRLEELCSTLRARF